MALFQTGNFTLASGKKSKWKIECDSLTMEDIRGLIQIAEEGGTLRLLGTFKEAVSVPKGGDLFAEVLSTKASPKAEDYLIVDDVLTTGGSILKVRQQLIDKGVHPRNIKALAFFKRVGNHVENSITRLPVEPYKRDKTTSALVDTFTVYSVVSIAG